MNTIVFIKPTHHYPSYDDFWRLVEVSGFLIATWADVDLTLDVTYIFTPWNGQVADVLPALVARDAARRRAHIVWWNLERDLADAPVEERRARLDKVALASTGAPRLVDEIWVSDRTYAALDDRFRFVVLGGHPQLAETKSLLFRTPYPQWAATLYAYVWGRRQLIVDALGGRGVSVAPPAWTHEDRQVVLANTGVMINTQQYDNARIVAPIRFAVAASFGMGLLSEPIDDPFPLVEGCHFVTTETTALAGACEEVFHDRVRFGRALYELLAEEHRFDKVVTAAVAR